MELRQLAYFVAIAEEGSFTRGAAREHVAQPGVSAQIRRLELELGQALFHRRPDGARLTAAGEAVLPFARVALAGAAGVHGAIAQLAGLLRGRVSFGVVPSVSGWLADALASFCGEHPEVEIELREGVSDALLGEVRGGALDLALVGLSGAPGPGVDSALLLEEPLVAAVHVGHRLARRRSISLRGLGEERLIALPLGTGGRAALETACRAAGVRLRVAFEAGDPRVLVELAARGLGVAIVPAGAPEGVAVLELTPAIRSRLELVWPAGPAPSPAARAFRDRVLASLAPRQPASHPAALVHPPAPGPLASAPVAGAAAGPATAPVEESS